MALFSFGKKEPFDRLRSGEWSGQGDRDALIGELLVGNNALVDADKVVALLFSSDNTVRRAALNRLQKLGNALAVDAFLQQVPGKPQAMVQSTIAVLPRVLPPAYTKRLTRYLEHRDGSVRRAAEDLLLGGGLSSEAISHVAEWLQPDGESRRAERLMAAVEREIQSAETPRGDLVGLARRGAEHPDEAVREHAYRTLVLTRDPEFLPFFVESIGQETYRNQQLLSEAIQQLVRVAGVDMSEALLPLLASTNPQMRTLAVDVLRRLERRETVIVRFFAYARTLAPWIRDRAFDALADLGDKLLPPLLSIMESGDAESQLMAIQLASTVGEDRRMLKPLMRLLNTAEDWWVRSTTAEALARIGDPAAISAFRQLMSDSDAVWIGVDGLAQLATSLHEAGDLRNEQAAIEPLAALLAMGQQQSAAVLQQEAVDLRLEVLTALRPLASPRILELFKKVALEDASQRVRAEAYTMAQGIASELGKSLGDTRALEAAVEASSVDINSLAGLDRLLTAARMQGASDVHITVGRPPMMRVKGRLSEMTKQKLDARHTAQMIRGIVEDSAAERIADSGQLEFCYEIPEIGRYRAGVFVDRRGVNGVFRVIPRNMPTVQGIGLPPKLLDVRDWHQGLMLVCGASGSGKSTTLAALVNLLNETRASHILTIEDPIEYVHRSRRSLVNQRELETHTDSYAAALRGALRQDPDVIVVGELRDSETVKLALEASETGHLVIGTLNCTRAETAIDRIIGAFDADEAAQARMALADSLKAILAQTLLPRADDSGMVAVFEVIMGLTTVAGVIRDAKTHMLASLMQTGRSQGMQTFDNALMELVKSNVIGPRVAWANATSKDLFAPMLSATPGEARS